MFFSASLGETAIEIDGREPSTGYVPRNRIGSYMVVIIVIRKEEKRSTSESVDDLRITQCC